MRVLLVGSGAREHALAWHIARSPQLEQLWVAPGNPGIAHVANVIPIPANDTPALVDFAVEHRCDLVVIGPEDPLADGLADAFRARNIATYGPSRRAALIESSKVFARSLAAKLGIPGPTVGSFRTPDEAKRFVRTLGPAPYVIKADGLFRGKGVVIAHTLQEADHAIDAMLVAHEFGNAGSTVLVEEHLAGRELSVMAICDGHTAVMLLPSRDHKRAYDGDLGPNTGGMGVIAPAMAAGDPTAARLRDIFVLPVLHELAAQGTPFVGTLYAGVMLTDRGPALIEYNARFGDPEAEAVLPLLATDLLPLLQAAASGQLGEPQLRWHPGSCVTVVLASPGYPDSGPQGLRVSGLDEAARLHNTLVFHAGTRQQGPDVVTSGGRVLCVAGLGPTQQDAAEHAYRAVSHIHWTGMHYRSDIGRQRSEPLQ